MSNIKRVCPFCGVPLFPEDFKSRFVCTKHDFHVDYMKCEAWFGDKTPNEFRESQIFLDNFFLHKPLFAVSPVKLFKEGFVAENVRYFGSDSFSLDNFVKPRHIKDGYLIAGNGLVAHRLLRHVCVLHEQKSEVSPLSLTHVDSKKYLFLLTMSESAECSYKVPRSLHAYLQPTLESMSSVICNMPFHEITPLTHERVLYSAIFMRPQDNIKWEVGSLKRNVTNFIVALTDVTPTPELLPFVLEEHFVSFPEHLLELEKKSPAHASLYNRALHSNFATAPNEGLSAFDIMEKNYHTVKGPGNTWTSNGLNEYMNAHNSLIALFDKYARPVTPMGLDKKKACLGQDDDQSTPDAIVMSFWSKVNKVLKKEN